MHLSDELIQRLLDVELHRSQEDETRAHLGGCPECRERVARARRDQRELESTLGLLDRPMPTLDVDVVVGLAREAEPAREVAVLQRAAGLVLALALVGAAYAAFAMPGSPVREWIASVAARIAGHRPPAPVAPADTTAAGIAVAPGRALVIVFTTPEKESSAEVALTDGPDVAVRAPSGAATYTAEAGRLVIDNQGRSATFAIEIPRDAPHVEILVGDVPLLLKDGAHIVGPASADTTAPYRLRLGR